MIPSARPAIPPVAITNSRIKIVLHDFDKWESGRTDDMSQNSDHYRSWWRVGLVDQCIYAYRKMSGYFGLPAPS